MNDMIISIKNTDISVKEYRGQRVVTFQDIDKVHERPDGTARRNFNANKQHFTEGEDYFVRNSYEAKNEFNSVAPNGLTLITESGYLLLVKSFTDDLAWDIQKMLIKNYFKVGGVPDISTSTIPDDLIRYLPKDGELIPVVVLKELTKTTGFPAWKWRDRLSLSCTYGKDYVTLKCAELCDFKSYNNVWSTGGGLTVIFQSGMDKLRRRYGIGTKCKALSPICEPEQPISTPNSELQQSFSALEVLSAQYKKNKSDEEAAAITKCFDMILSDIREKSLSK